MLINLSQIPDLEILIRQASSNYRIENVEFTLLPEEQATLKAEDLGNGDIGEWETISFPLISFLCLSDIQLQIGLKSIVVYHEIADKIINGINLSENLSNYINSERQIILEKSFSKEDIFGAKIRYGAIQYAWNLWCNAEDASELLNSNRRQFIQSFLKILLEKREKIIIDYLESPSGKVTSELLKKRGVGKNIAISAALEGSWNNSIRGPFEGFMNMICWEELQKFSLG